MRLTPFLVSDFGYLLASTILAIVYSLFIIFKSTLH